MRDLQPFKNSLMTLSYEEKIEMSEWLHKQIEFEMKDAVKEKAKKVSGQVDNFLDKAATVTKTGANSLKDMFNEATGKKQ